jgi:hypothetical protein
MMKGRAMTVVIGEACGSFREMHEAGCSCSAATATQGGVEVMNNFPESLGVMIMTGGEERRGEERRGQQNK